MPGMGRNVFQRGGERSSEIVKPAPGTLLIWVDDEHVLTFVKAIDRADFDAIGVFASGAIVSNDEDRGGSLNIYEMYLLIQASAKGRSGLRCPYMGRLGAVGCGEFGTTAISDSASC